MDGSHARRAFQQHYANVVVVAKSGGDYTTVTAALNSITDASDTNRYLVKVMPGIYTEQVTMKPYADIEGAGELATTITGTGSRNPLPDTGTVVGADNAELRFLTVANAGGSMYAIAIYNHYTAPRLTHVTASASGGFVSYGVFNDHSSPTMQNVTASASTNVSGETYCIGVYNLVSSPTTHDVTASASGGTSNRGWMNYWSSLTMQDVTASASGGSESWGVYNLASSPTMQNVTASASGGTDNRGVYNEGYSDGSYPLTMQNVTASASGGTYSYGVFNNYAWPTIQNSSLSASGGTSNYGVANNASGGSYTVRINNSQVTASTAAIRNDTEFYHLCRRLAAGRGAVVTGGGTVTCAGVIRRELHLLRQYVPVRSAP